MDDDVVYTLKCLSCGASFNVNEGEVKFYTSKSLDIPKRCKPCRKEKKRNRRRTARILSSALKGADQSDGNEPDQKKRE